MAQSKKDLYAVLGVSKDASAEDIKKAYHKLARQYHPDINKEPGAEDKFKEINSAYEILGDEQRRAQYDRFGITDDMEGAGGFDFSSFFQNQSGFDPFSDLFNMFTNGGYGNAYGNSQSQRTYTGPIRGEDLYQRMDLEFLEAVKGTTKTITVDVEEPCEHCHGSGAESPSDIKQCSTCHGAGRVSQVINTPFGRLQQQTTCPTCHGTGQVVEKKCHECHGEGYHTERHQIDVKIPAGVQTGQQVRLAGKGGRGSNGGQNGDLYIELNVADHPIFQRQGADIFVEVPISSLDATLGCTIQVPTIHGESELNIPSGTQPGQSFRLKGQGIPYGRGNGDEYVDIKVEIPKKLNEKDRELYEQLRNQEATKAESPFERFKNFFTGK